MRFNHGYDPPDGFPFPYTQQVWGRGEKWKPLGFLNSKSLKDLTVINGYTMSRPTQGRLHRSFTDQIKVNYSKTRTDI